MSIVVVGSVAFDTIETPSGRVDHALGGAATHFALAASYFTQVRVIGVVGEDFNSTHEDVLRQRGVDTSGIEHVSGKSFHWTGSYTRNLNEADTLATELNVFETFMPKIPESYRDSEFLFLANIDPKLQAGVRRQMPHVKMVCGDTMNYWIKDHRPALAEVLVDLDVLLINDGEVKMLGGDTNLVRAAKHVQQMGVKTLVVKHGEYGATVFFSDRSFPGAHAEAHAIPFRAPALPLADVVDPTGAGDSFAGGFFGYLASQRGTLPPQSFRRAMFYGGVMGSFAVEKFGTTRTQELTREEIDARFEQLRALSHLD